MRPWLSLLLLMLVTLALPWDAVRYARQMETGLRRSERLDLSSLAHTLAASLAGRTRLIYRFAAEARHCGPDTLTPVPLPAPIDFNTYPEGWPPTRQWRRYGSGVHHFDILTGVSDRMLYVLLRISAPHPVFDEPFANPLDRAAVGERIWIGFGGPQGRSHAEFLPLEGAGPLVADRVITGKYGQRRAIPDPRIVGALQRAPGGYDVEFAMPLAMIGGPFGVLIEDRERRGARPFVYGMLNRHDLRPRDRLVLASAALPAYLQRLLRPGLRLSVTSPSGALLAQASQPVVPDIPAPHAGMLTLLFRRLAGAGHNVPITSRAAIRGRTGTGVIAYLEVTQTSDRWAHVRDQTLEQMLDLTLATSTLTFLAAVALAVQMMARVRRGNRGVSA
jgi:hypothetical protein